MRIARLCRYLPEFGIRPIVLTVTEGHHEDVDNTYLALPGVRVERAGMLSTPMDLYRHINVRVRPRHRDAADPASAEPDPAKAPGVLSRHGRALLETADPYWGWYLPATRMARQLIVAERVAAVFSSVPP